MSTNNTNNEQLNTLINAMLSQDIPTGPSEQLMESTAEAMHAVARVPTQEVSPTMIPKSQAGMFRTRGARMIRSRILGYTVALVILACATSGVFVFNGEAQRSFAEVIENVRNSTLTRYVYSTERSNTGKTGFSICSVSDSAVRVERYSAGKQHGVTWIVDLEKKTILQLNVMRSRACLYPMEANLPSNYGNPLGMMADITEENATLVDTVWNHGKAVDIYKLSQFLPSSLGIVTSFAPSDEDSFRIWVDRETQLPTRMVFHYKPSHEDDDLKIEITDFQWNAEPEPGMFDMTIPSGFEVFKDLKDYYGHGQAPAVEDHTHPPHKHSDEMHPPDHGYQHKNEPASQ